MAHVNIILCTVFQGGIFDLPYQTDLVGFFSSVH